MFAKRFDATFLILLLSGSLAAQDITGNLEGRVVDAAGLPMSGVSITLHGESLQGSRGVATSEDGFFNILLLPVGIYEVRVSRVGYRPVVLENVRVKLAGTSALGKITLEHAAVDLPEIVITHDKLTIDPGTARNGGNLDSEHFDRIPLARDYKEIIVLLPYANSSYFGDGTNIGGSTGFENKYFVDGVEVTNPDLGYGATSLPLNFIKEIELKTGGYEVEFRSSLGGLVNAVTKSGSNEFHGSFFGFYTGNSLTGNKRTGLRDPSQGNYTDYDVGFDLSGPVIQDRIWFLVAYNPTVREKQVNVPGFGIAVDKTVTHSFASKLSWRASQRLQCDLSATGDPAKWNAVGRNVFNPPTLLLNPDPYFMDIRQGGVNLSLNGVYTLGQDIQISAFVTNVMRNSTNEPSTVKGREDLFYVEPATNTWAGGTPYRWDTFTSGTTVGLRGTLQAGAHILKLGIEYRTRTIDYWEDQGALVKVDSNLYRRNFARFAGKVFDRSPSVFVQDSWQIMRGFRINGGIRWDGQYIYGTDQELAQTVTVPLQPRVGVTFIPDIEGSSKIYGSFGRFSQEYALLPSVIYHSNLGYHYAIGYDHDPRIDPSGGDTLYYVPHTIRPEVEGFRGQFYDEFSLGYERLLSEKIRLNVQGVYRTLREAIDDVWLTDENTYQYGNPGRGILISVPRPRRISSSFVVTIQQTNRGDFSFLASYVLSSNHGNYEGLFDSFIHSVIPNHNWAFDDINNAKENTSGFMPNDRTHVFKAIAFYRFSGLTAGVHFVLQSGTPLSELAVTDFGVKFLSPRGSVGRTPTIWDLSTRFAYDLPLASSLHPRLILDISHIASQRKPVDVDQVRYFSVDSNGDPGNPNPNYGKAYRYQPPTFVRLGMEVRF